MRLTAIAAAAIALVGASNAAAPREEVVKAEASHTRD